MSSNGTFEFINGLRLEHWANGHVLVDGGDGYIDGDDNENGDADVCGDHDPSMKPLVPHPVIALLVKIVPHFRQVIQICHVFVQEIKVINHVSCVHRMS